MAGDSHPALTNKAQVGCEAIMRTGGASHKDVVAIDVRHSPSGYDEEISEEYAQWLHGRTGPCKARAVTARLERCTSDDLASD